MEDSSPVRLLVHWWTLDCFWSIVLVPILLYRLVKAYWWAAEKCINFCAALEYVLPVHKNPVVVKLSKMILELLVVIDLVSHPSYTICPIQFHLSHGENGKYNRSSGNYIKSSKTSRGSCWTYCRTIHLCQEILSLSRDPVPLILIPLSNINRGIVCLLTYLKGYWT